MSIAEFREIKPPTEVLYPATAAAMNLLCRAATPKLDGDWRMVNSVGLRRVRRTVRLAFGADAIEPLDLRWTCRQPAANGTDPPSMNHHDGLQLGFKAYNDRSPYVAPGDIEDDGPFPAGDYLLLLGRGILPYIAQKNRHAVSPETAFRHPLPDRDATQLLPVVRSLRIDPAINPDGDL